MDTKNNPILRAWQDEEVVFWIGNSLIVRKETLKTNAECLSPK